MMNLNLKKHIYTIRDFSLAFLKWVLVAALCGAIGGLIGAAFDKSVGFVSDLFGTYSWLLVPHLQNGRKRGYK